MRQNKETHLEIGQDEVVNKIEFRIARYTFLPGYNGEPLHIMYTTPGHGYGMQYSLLCESLAVSWPVDTWPVMMSTGHALSQRTSM